jgi:hypothetical protein
MQVPELDIHDVVVVAGFDDKIHRLDADSLQPLAAPLSLADVAPFPGDEANSVASTRLEDGTVIVAATGRLGQAAVWQFTGAEATPMGSVEGSVIGVAFAPDGRLITVQETGDFQLRDPHTLEVVARFDSAVFPTFFSFSDTGWMVASGATGAEVWDFKERYSLSGALAAAASAISEDGSTLFLGGLGFGTGGSRVHSFPLEVSVWPGEACKRAGRNLTISEWQTFMPAGDEYRATCSEWHAAR